jgi:hypothetical protein
MDVIVYLHPEAARSLRQGSSTGAARDAADAADAFGLRLEPMHPDPTDPRAAGAFVVRAPDPATAASVAERLRACAAVEHVYAKPHDAPP